MVVPKTEPGYFYKKPPRSLTIELADEDCKKGVCGDPENCPVKLALTATCFAGKAVVGWRLVKIFHGKYEYHYSIPHDLGQQIKSYDQGKPCWRPGRYELTPYLYRTVPAEEKAKRDPNRSHGTKEWHGFQGNKTRPRQLVLHSA